MERTVVNCTPHFRLFSDFCQTARNAARKSFGRAAVFRAIQSCRCNAFHFLSRLMTALCQRNRTFHRKLFPLPVVPALHPRLKLLPGAFPRQQSFCGVLVRSWWGLLPQNRCLFHKRPLFNMISYFSFFTKRYNFSSTGIIKILIAFIRCYLFIVM